VRLTAAELSTSHLIEYDDVLCRILATTPYDYGTAVLVRVLPESAFAEPLILHFWSAEEVDVCGWTC
jgi:hypothetical protein